MNRPTNLFTCPLCSFPLTQNAQGLSCANRHQFDRAKEGYFNLLPVQQKNSREPGDAKQQLESRRTFLSAGYFSPLLDELKRFINPETRTILDVGCGEGYFTRGLGEHCKQAEVYGIDISKVGIRLASKKDMRGSYAVASSYALPFVDGSMETVVRIYAPSKDEELARVVAPDGRLIIVTPGAEHLIGLRKAIYKEVRPYQTPKTPKGFSEICQSRVSFGLDVASGELSNALLDMTPFAWKFGVFDVGAISAPGIADQADFLIHIYKPNH